MSKVTKFFLRPQVNLAGAALSALAEIISWFAAFDDAYRVTPVAFILCVVFLGLFALNEHLSAERLRSEARPKLELVFDKGQLYDSLHFNTRVFRVGVRNSGATVADVAVKVTRVLPELPRVFPMQELQQTHEEEGTSRFAVNKNDEPLVFVDLIKGISRALLKLSGGSVHDYATISDDSPSPSRASRAWRAATSAGISLHPFTRRNSFAASITPAATQRSTIVPPRHRFTFRFTWRVRLSRLSMAFVVASDR